MVVACVHPRARPSNFYVWNCKYSKVDLFLEQDRENELRRDWIKNLLKFFYWEKKESLEILSMCSVEKYLFAISSRSQYATSLRLFEGSLWASWKRVQQVGSRTPARDRALQRIFLSFDRQLPALFHPSHLVLQYRSRRIVIPFRRERLQLLYSYSDDKIRSAIIDGLKFHLCAVISNSFNCHYVKAIM